MHVYAVNKLNLGLEDVPEVLRRAGLEDPADCLELVCNDRVVPPDTSLMTIRKFFSRSSRHTNHTRARAVFTPSLHNAHAVTHPHPHPTPTPCWSYTISHTVTLLRCYIHCNAHCDPFRPAM